MCDEDECRSLPQERLAPGQHTNVYPSQLRCLSISLVKKYSSLMLFPVVEENVQTANYSFYLALFRKEKNVVGDHDNRKSC